jgi:dimeric dUTPase (all-alpha-NTP-PPase superfamily)
VAREILAPIQGRPERLSSSLRCIQTWSENIKMKIPKIISKFHTVLFFLATLGINLNFLKIVALQSSVIKISCHPLS